MKPRPAEVERLLKAPPPTLRAVLLFGPDSSLVRERAEVASRAIVPDLTDPFRVAELGGDQVAADPARLADEAAAIAMTGGRRVVRVRGAGEAATGAFEAFLADPHGDALVVVEAGDIGTKARLVKLFEGAGNAAAIACYETEGGALDDVVAARLTEMGLEATPDIVGEIAARVGADRYVLRSEIAKLALYVDGPRADVADVRAIVTAASEADLDDLVDAVSDGDLAATAQAAAEALAAGEAPVRMLRTLTNHLLRLYALSGHMASGADFDEAVSRAKLFLPWPRKAALKRQTGRWPRPRVEDGLALLMEAERLVKSTGYPEETVAARAALQLAALARSR